MFTGIVTDVGRIAAVSSGERLRRIRIESAYRPETIALGASIACGGPCLTVVAAGGRGEGCWFEVDAAAETIARTNVSEWKVGTRVNLERSLSIGDELGGHIVTGHVDGLATILAREAVTPGEDPWGRDRAVRDRGAARPFPVHRGKGLGLSRRHLADGQFGRRTTCSPSSSSPIR